MLGFKSGILCLGCGTAPDSGMANDPVPPHWADPVCLKVPELPQGSPLGKAWHPLLCPAHHLRVSLAVRAAGAGLVEEPGVPGRGGEGWWKLPEAAGARLGVGRRDTGVGSRLFPTLPQGSLYITRAA